MTIEDRVLEAVREVLLTEPWEHSREGLDDECNYCGGWYRKWKGSDGEGTSQHAYEHLAGCVWMKWAPLLGLNMDGHRTEFIEVD